MKQDGEAVCAGGEADGAFKKVIYVRPDTSVAFISLKQQVRMIQNMKCSQKIPVYFECNVFLSFGTICAAEEIVFSC